MNAIQFDHPVKVHFIGIGGISMSGLAEVLLQRGFTVTGSDAKESELTRHLSALGAGIFIGQKAENISADTKAVVYTAAIHPDNPEYVKASEMGLPLINRADLLGQVMANYTTSIAVAGTHGKTTTTSMMSEILLAADADPTISVGGILPSIGGNIRVGTSDTFLTEACEYTNSYHSLSPYLAIVLNVDADHLDFFRDIEEIRRSFRTFAGKIPAEGALILNADTPSWEVVAGGASCRVYTYGIDAADADFTASGICFDERGFGQFHAWYQGRDLGEFTLSVPGIHNISNALAAIAAVYALQLPLEAARTGLAAFTGVDRRFQKKGEYKEAVVVDDYAHHPTEIRATLKAAGQGAYRKVWCVFQPHTYTRTKSLLAEFGEALSLADHVVLADIYPAREQDIYGISSKDLQAEILQNGTACEHFPSFEAIEEYLKSVCQPGDLILTMGAGDIYLVGDHLLSESSYL